MIFPIEDGNFAFVSVQHFSAMIPMPQQKACPVAGLDSRKFTYK